MKSSLFLNKTYSRKEIMGLVESLLFVNGKSVSANDLMELLEMNKSDLNGLIEEMNAGYLERSAGFNIIQIGGGYQLVSNPQYKDELVEIFGKRNENQLSKSLLETLAIIAYKQPISKEEVDRIRGVSSTRSVNSLLGLKMINISGSTDGIVKSPVYSVTSRFFELFRINSLDDLPSIENLDWDEIGDEMEDTLSDEAEENENAADDEMELTL